MIVRLPMRSSLIFAFLLLLAASAALRAQMPGQSTPDLPKTQVTQSAAGFDATLGKEIMHLAVCSDSIIHITTRPNATPADHPQPWLLPAAQSCPGAPFQLTQDAQTATVKTAALTITLSKDRGNLTYSTADGKPLLRESDAVPRTYAPVEINGDQTFHVVERFSPNFTEAFYGLGQHQSGMFNYRGATVELGQNNTDIAIPVLVSTTGYGILWNTAALTSVDNRFPLSLNFDSMAGDGVDYFFLYGPEPDSIIHDYRNLTGHAPMLPRWSYGFIQSKDRYKSLDEINTIASRYRSEHIPLDVIVQDWFWWKTEGDPVFNENYHDVPADLKKLHDQNIHTMISTWGLIDPAAETYKKLDAEGLFVPNAHVYDASSPRARDIYWSSLINPLFAQGWDSFWLDSAEPEEFWPHMGDAILRDKKIHIGNGAMYTNIYPLLHNEGIQEHWKKANDQKRVFLLTRSAFLGQQRVGGTVWSGDVFSSYWGLSHQIAAGLNYAISGLPYWTTDIGGYWPTTDPDQQSPAYPTLAYQELYLRWFQFGVFCPVFRSHGHRPNNEIWSYPAIEPQLIAFDKLRYRLMPYIYSLAWQVSSHDYTIQRPLVMDWRSDPQTWNIGDQFMFGPALLVNPVIEAKATRRRLYLPKTLWYDFWTGEKFTGGAYIQAPAPLDRLPLYVRAGSILPLGPDEQYAEEKPNGPIELRIYPGADGHFSLYQDSGDGYDYQRGEHLQVPITWSDADHTLTLGDLEGQFPGMPSGVTLNIVLVRPGKGAGPAETAQPDRSVYYSGTEIKVKLDQP